MACDERTDLVASVDIYETDMSIEGAHGHEIAKVVMNDSVEIISEGKNEMHIQKNCLIKVDNLLHSTSMQWRNLSVILRSYTNVCYKIGLYFKQVAEGS